MNNEAPGPRRLWLVPILAVGAVLRFSALLSLPIFNDEVIYALWARSILGGRQWLIPLSDGKQPLYYWLAAFTTGLLNDPLLGLRAASVLAGMAGIVGVYLAGVVLAERRVGLLAAGFYALVPFAVIYDRIGLPDGLLAACGAYLLWAAVKLGRAQTRTRATALGVAFCAAFLVKTTALLLAPVAVLGIVVGMSQVDETAGQTLTIPSSDRLRGAIKISLKPLALASIPVALMLAIAPFGPSVVGKSSSFLLSAGELDSSIYQRWFINIESLGHWLANYIQWPALLIICGALMLGGRRFRGYIRVSLAAAGGPLVLMMLAARTWFSRYALISAPFLALAVGAAIAAFSETGRLGGRRKLLPALMIALLGIVALRQDFLLLDKPAEFAWAADDRWQFVEGWPSGYGFAGAVNYIRRRSDNVGPGVLTLLVDKNMGFPKDGLILNLIDKKIRVIAVDGGRPLPKPADESRPHIYIADEPRLNQPDFARRHRNWALAATFKKPGNRSLWAIYEFRHKPKIKNRFRR